MSEFTEGYLIRRNFKDNLIKYCEKGAIIKDIGEEWCAYLLKIRPDFMDCSRLSFYNAENFRRIWRH